MSGQAYKLWGKKVIKCGKDEQWYRAFSQDVDRHVGDTTIGDVRVSTVFLVIDHQWGSGPPLLFETMVFGGEYDQDQERYSTWKQAEKGHRAMCKKVFGKEVE